MKKIYTVIGLAFLTLNTNAQCGTNPVPIADFSFSNVCAGHTINFTNASTITGGTIASWKWNFGDGSPISTSQNTSHQYSSAGSYVIKLLITSNFGCKDSISKTSKVNPNPVVNFTSNDTSGCDPLCVSFQSSSSIATGVNSQWLWNFGDGSPTSNSQNFLSNCYTNTSANQIVYFTVTLTVTSDSDCVTTKSKNNYIIVDKCTGISELVNNFSMEISPNPFTTETTIAFNEEQNRCVLKIIDVLGKEIRNTTFSGKQFTLEKGELKEGIYFLQIIDKNKNVKVKKIIIQ